MEMCQTVYLDLWKFMFPVKCKKLARRSVVTSDTDTFSIDLETIFEEFVKKKF